MSENLEALRKRIESVGKLQSVVKTLKTLAASQVRQLEIASLSLEAYENVLTTALITTPFEEKVTNINDHVAYIVWGSDQGLIGQFNDQLRSKLKNLIENEKGHTHVFAVGEKLYDENELSKSQSFVYFKAPTNLEEVVPLLELLLFECDKLLSTNSVEKIHLLYQTPQYEQICVPTLEQLFPLETHPNKSWPNKNIPEVLGDKTQSRQFLINEFLFFKLSKTCVKSLTSENISRLVAMQRAEKNIEEVLEQLHSNHHHVRQNMIDAELFDIISGFESL